MADPVALLDATSEEHGVNLSPLPLKKRKLYVRRWYILAVVSFLSFVQGWIWNTYGPIAITVKNATVFNWDNAAIAWMALWGPIGYFLSFAPTAWCLDTLKLRPSAIVAAALVLAGTLVRMIKTDNVPLYNGTNITATTIVQHVGQAFNGLAGPFAMSAGTVLSAAWFAAEERTTSTAIFCTANQVGVTLSYLVGPLIVPPNGDTRDVREYLWLCVALATFAMLLTLAYLPSTPPEGDEPSASAAKARTPICDGVCALLRNPNFWLVAIAYGFTTGFFAGWGPLYAVIIQWLGPTIAPNPQETASWVGFWSSIAGNIASMLFGWILDRGVGRRRVRALLIILSALAALTYAAFAVLILEHSWLQAGGLATVYVLCILSAIFVMGPVPMFFELAVDAVYPVAEGLTTTVLTVVNNLACFVFMIFPIVGINIGDWVNYSVGGACLVSVVMMILFRGRLNRSDADDTPRAQVQHKSRPRQPSEDCFAQTGATEQEV